MTPASFHGRAYSWTISVVLVFSCMALSAQTPLDSLRPKLFIPKGITGGLDFLQRLSLQAHDYLLISGDEVHLFNLSDSTEFNIYSLPPSGTAEPKYTCNGKYLIINDDQDPDSSNLCRISILDAYTGEIKTQLHLDYVPDIHLAAGDSLLALVSGRKIEFYNLAENRFLPETAKFKVFASSDSVVILLREKLTVTKDLSRRKDTLVFSKFDGRIIKKYAGDFSHIKNNAANHPERVSAILGDTLFYFIIDPNNPDSIRKEVKRIFSFQGFDLDDLSDDGDRLVFSKKEDRERSLERVYDLSTNSYIDSIDTQLGYYGFSFLKNSHVLTYESGDVPILGISQKAPSLEVHLRDQALPMDYSFHALKEYPLVDLAVSDKQQLIAAVNVNGDIAYIDFQHHKTKVWNWNGVYEGFSGRELDNLDVAYPDVPAIFLSSTGVSLIVYRPSYIAIVNPLRDSLRFFRTIDPVILDGDTVNKVPDKIRKVEEVKPGQLLVTQMHTIRLLDFNRDTIIQVAENRHKNTAIQYAKLLDDSTLLVLIDTLLVHPAKRWRRSSLSDTTEYIGTFQVLRWPSGQTIYTFENNAAEKYFRSYVRISPPIIDAALDPATGILSVYRYNQTQLNISPTHACEEKSLTNSGYASFLPKNAAIAGHGRAYKIDMMRASWLDSFAVSEKYWDIFRLINDSLAFRLEGGKAIAYSVNPLRPLATLMTATQNRDWITFNSSGFFDCSSGSLGKIFWKIDQRTYPLEQFYDNFYTPGMLYRIYDRKDFTDIPDIALFLKIPSMKTLIRDSNAVVRVVSGQKYLCFRNVEPLTLQLLKTTANLYPLNVKIPALSDAFQLIVPLPANDGYFTAGPDPPLPSKDSFYFMPPHKGRLILGAIGIGQYPSTSGLQIIPNVVKNLSAFARLFIAPERDTAAAYDSTAIFRPLLDSSATSAGILQYLNGIINLSKDGDLIVLYFFGHGEIPENSELFYFMTYDSQHDNYKRAINTAVFGDLIKLLSNRRVLLIIDACQSGGTMESLNKLAALLQQENAPGGVGHSSYTVIASSSPLQLSFQSPDGSLLMKMLEKAFAALDGKKGATRDDLVQQFTKEITLDNSTHIFNETPMIFSIGSNYNLFFTR